MKLYLCYIELLDMDMLEGFYNSTQQLWCLHSVHCHLIVNWIEAHRGRKYGNMEREKYHAHAVHAADKLFGAAAWVKYSAAAAFGGGAHPCSKPIR